MTGVRFTDLANLDGSQDPQPGRGDLHRALQHPTTITVTADPITALGLALAIASGRGEPVAVIDPSSPGQITPLTGTPAGDLVAIAALLPRLRQETSETFAASGYLVDVFQGEVAAPDLVEVHSVVCRTYQVVIVLGDTAATLGLGDVVVHPIRWTQAAVAHLTGALDAAHRSGNPVVGRTIITPQGGDADPGMEQLGRNWLAAFPICPIPADPATAMPPVTWEGLREVTRTAYLNLATTTLRSL